MFSAYLSRDNKISVRLLLNGATVTESVVTKAQLLIPGEYTVSGNDILLDSSVDSSITLASNATIVNFSLGSVSVNPGLAHCYLTIFDAVNTTGLAWAQMPIRFLTWKP